MPVSLEAYAMIIWGSRMYGQKNVVKGVGACPHCGKYGANRSYDGSKWGHLYFIPLVPMGGKVRVMHECAACKMGSHMPQASVQRMVGEIETLMGLCVESATAGTREFADPKQGQPVANDGFLLEAADLLYHSGHGNELPGLIELLNTDASRYEHGITLGVVAELKGDDNGAVIAYRSAVKADPDQPQAFLLLSDVLMRRGDAEGSLQMIERAEQLVPENAQLLMAKTRPLEVLGRYEELVDALDRAIQIAPALGHDKGVAKMRKKFGKKAAKQAR